MSKKRSQSNDEANLYRELSVRTTNHVEAWHKALNKRVKASHVNIFDMVRHLREDDNHFNNGRLLLDAGNPPPRMRKTWRDLNERISKLKDELETEVITLKDYVRRMAYCLHDHGPDDETPVEQAG